MLTLADSCIPGHVKSREGVYLDVMCQTCIQVPIAPFYLESPDLVPEVI